MARGEDRTPLPAQAFFRYHVVSLVRAHLLAGRTLAAAVAEVVDHDHPTLAGDFCRISRRSVYRWVALYVRGGVEALGDRPRDRVSASRVLDPRLLAFLKAERGQDQEASIPELLRRARAKGFLAPAQPVDRTTVYRALVRMAVPTGRVKMARGRDQRRYAYAHRMEMVLADGKHFRAGAKRCKRVALFFLDDATRLGLHVAVGPSESAELFLPALYAVLAAHGRMGILYLDHGSGFIATAVAMVCRRLKIALVHGKARYPQGHGKIEKFNQTVGNEVLRRLDGRPDVDPDCAALAHRLGHWLHHLYNHQPHSSLVRP